MAAAVVVTKPGLPAAAAAVAVALVPLVRPAQTPATPVLLVAARLAERLIQACQAARGPVGGLGLPVPLMLVMPVRPPSMAALAAVAPQAVTGHPGPAAVQYMVPAAVVPAAVPTAVTLPVILALVEPVSQFRAVAAARPVPQAAQPGQLVAQVRRLSREAAVVAAALTAAAVRLVVPAATAVPPAAAVVVAAPVLLPAAPGAVAASVGYGSSAGKTLNILDIIGWSMKIPKLSKKTATISVLVIGIILGGFLFYIKQSLANPLPDNIKQSISYKVIYPSSKTATVKQNSYQYQSKDRVLSYKAEAFGVNIVFTQQPLPDNISTGDQAYYPALGIHPYAQFKSKLGSVALTKFWESSNLEPKGQSAVMAAENVLLIAHPDRALSNDQWKQLFDSLKITK